MERKPFLYVTAITLILLAAVFVTNQLMKPIEGPAGIDPQINFIQYAGSFVQPQDQWVIGRDIITSSVAVLGDYRIETETASFGRKYGPWYCQPNSCGGEPAGYDERFCPLYTGFKEQICQDIPAWREAGSCASGCSASQITKFECYGNDRGTDAQPPKLEPPWTCVYCLGTGNVRVVSYAMLPSDCGGSTRDELYQSHDCWSKHKIYRNNVLINETDWNDRNTVIRYDDISMNLHYADLYSAYCRRIENSYNLLIPENSFQISITTPTPPTFQGEEITLNASTSNNWKQIRGNLSLYLEIQTGLQNPSTETRSYTQDIPLGNSLITSTIPSSQATEIKVKPNLDLLLSGAGFSGVNAECSGSNEIDNVANCELIKIGNIPGNTFSIQITPRDCRIDGCPEGQACNNETGTCKISGEEEEKFPFFYYMIGIVIATIILSAIGYLIHRRKR